MKATIKYMAIGGILMTAVLAAGCSGPVQRVTYAVESVPAAETPEGSGTILYLTEDNMNFTSAPSSQESGTILNPSGQTLDSRFQPPAGYSRIPKEMGSFQGYLRRYRMKEDRSPVLLYDGNEKRSQSAHMAVFTMPVFDTDLQQCADSVMRIYAEYFWAMGDYDRIKFHLTNGFLMDYPSWRSGKRLSVNGNHTSWVTKTGYDDSYECFLKYLKIVMSYAGTLSLDQECTPVEPASIQAGDMFIKGGSPGHCVMVADVAEDAAGNRCFLLAQGYMPAQEFQILKNPLHEDDPWYYSTELEYPLVTPEYVFEKGSLKRWQGFVY